MLNLIISFILILITVFVLLASVRLLIEPYIQIPKAKFISFITSPLWCLFLFVLLPLALRDFSLGDLEFSFSFVKNYLLSNKNIFDKLYPILVIPISVLWLYILPSHIWIQNNKEKIDSKIKNFARILNFFVGIHYTGFVGRIFINELFELFDIFFLIIYILGSLTHEVANKENNEI
ncbi:hypothetical protein FHQ18_00405 [Deferribacter autotrophicus]|uniref:Uncharacterized protein n=1 Tax=Deferribacter autotrophicus TaxID=500465 RepID=A0A5A8F923_9BACT|nr:hypothetical protein [Deferribacter autotrophicus]KAA0259372.1 hypothetical protein FHQ18_00405 [Deferribacter autotrophicus]